MVLVNTRSGETIANDVELAVTSAARRRGLLGRDHLAPTSAMMLSPCWAIHTGFMRFPIDVVFVDRRNRVVRVVHDLVPWRLAGAFRAHSVIEFAGGSLRTRDLRPGDELSLRSEAPQQALAG
jgi:uncharacterized membrane protein (UPF0127 family)